MKPKSMLKFSAALMIIVGLTACQNTDRSGNAQLDSAPVGSDSLRRADNSDAPSDVTHMSKVDGDGAAFMDTAAVGGMMEVDLGKLAYTSGFGKTPSDGNSGQCFAEIKKSFTVIISNDEARENYI